MNKKKWTILTILLAAALLILFRCKPKVEEPIVIGCPLSTGFLYGWDAEKAINLAVEEINAAGGVSVGDKKRPLKVEVIDTRDLEPGVPVSEALLAVEKLILGKGADFIVGGPCRSEAALAAMGLVSQYKRVSIISAGVLSPRYHTQIARITISTNTALG